MSMIIGRKQIILAALVLALGTAIFLNYQFSKTKTGFDLAGLTTTSKGNLGDAKYVDNQNVANTSGTSYFVTARLTRQKTRDQALDVLKNVNSKASQAEKTQAITQMEVIAGNIVKEGKIENLVISKGFKDCMAFISDDSVNVVVKPKTAASLNSSDVIQIKDIVLSQTKVIGDNIHIIESK